jgi:hypothetical protein
LQGSTIAVRELMMTKIKKIVNHRIEIKMLY